MILRQVRTYIRPAPPAVCAGALPSGFCGPRQYLPPAAAAIASTTFHLLVISNEPEV